MTRALHSKGGGPLAPHSRSSRPPDPPARSGAASSGRPCARLLAGGPVARLGRSALVVLLLAAVGVFHVWSRTRVLAAGYTLGELQKEHVTFTSEHDRLHIEVETLRSPAVLEKVARTRLGMAPPAPGAVSAAGPHIAEAGEGGEGVVGAKHRPGPAEPSRSRGATGILVAGRTPPGR